MGMFSVQTLKIPKHIPFDQPKKMYARGAFESRGPEAYVSSASVKPPLPRRGTADLCLEFIIF